MQDRPTAPELLEAVRDFLERDVLPSLAARGPRYRMLIALNVLRIVEREIPGREARLSAELSALAGLLGRPVEPLAAGAAGLDERVQQANRELCERIRAGEADAGPWRARVLDRLEAMVAENLAVNDPQRLAVVRGERGGER